MRYSPTILAAVGALAALSPANLAAQDQMPTAEVYFGDLNLTTDQGQARLNSRIDRAITLVCGDDHPFNVLITPSIRACHRETMAAVIPVRDDVIDRALRGQGTVEVLAFSVPRTRARR